MWSHAAQALGYRTAVLDPDAQSPAGLVSHVHVCADYLDPAALAEMAAQCKAITTKTIHRGFNHGECDRSS
jgi:5-(carboxyamino)imidazole ribonucleotide synthase